MAGKQGLSQLQQGAKHYHHHRRHRVLQMLQKQGLVVLEGELLLLLLRQARLELVKFHYAYNHHLLKPCHCRLQKVQRLLQGH